MPETMSDAKTIKPCTTCLVVLTINACHVYIQRGNYLLATVPLLFVIVIH